MKPYGRLALLTGAWVACLCAVALATSFDHTVADEVRTLGRLVTQGTQREFPDEDAFFAAAPAYPPQGKPSVLDRLSDALGERRVHFGPPRQGPGPRRPFAVTAFRRGAHGLAFCADTTPLVCVRRDGFEPRVRVGRCDDPRCEVFARGEEVQEADTVWLRRDSSFSRWGEIKRYFVFLGYLIDEKVREVERARR